MTPEELKRSVFPGESGGDYNALFGFSNRPGGQFSGVNLTDMTVNQALNFAAPSGPYGQGVKRQIGRVATPMGAYQVVGTTLEAAKKGLGLTGAERMDEGLQDQIGMWIYQNQGPGAWAGWGKQGSSGGNNANISVSSKGGGAMPAGLLSMDEEPQTFGQRLKRDFKSGDLMDRIALAANSLRMDPDPGVVAMVQGRQQQRADKATSNRTAQWLQASGRPDLAQALMAGALDPKSAVAMAYQKPDAVNGVEVDGRLINPQTGEVIYGPADGTSPTLTSDQLTALNTLRDDASTASAELGAMRDAWDNVNTFYKNPGSVSDRALVIAFAKILDPGSVVRETESAAIANSGSLDEGMRALLLNALQGGGNLPPAIRTEIMSLAREMYANKMPSVENRIKMLTMTAERAGLPTDLVFSGSLTPPVTGTVATPPPTPAPGPNPAPAPGPAPAISPRAQTYLP